MIFIFVPNLRVEFMANGVNEKYFPYSKGFKYGKFDYKNNDNEQIVSGTTTLQRPFNTRVV